MGVGRALRVVSIGSLPPEWGGPVAGGVATVHATLLAALRDRPAEVEVVGIVPPAPPRRALPAPVFARPDREPVAAFYERLLDELAPDVVVMHHFAHTIGVTHARLGESAPPAVGVAHSWHNITFRDGGEREHARATTEEALGGLSAIVGGSEHVLREGRELGLALPAIAEVIHHPLRRLFASGELDVTGGERAGILYLGELTPRKRPATLLDAAALISGVDVFLGGRGELEPALREQAGRLGLSERVAVAELGAGDVRDRLLGAELMCLPSSSESLGLAYVEALACGTPVVGFGPTVREIRAVVGVDIGEPIDSDDPAELAAAIERVRAARWDRRELRRSVLATFGPRAAIDCYADLLGRVAARAAVGNG